MKGSPEEIAQFRRLVDVIEKENAHQSALVMLGLLSMMLDGLEIFHGLPREESIRAALEHLDKMRPGRSAS